MSYRAFSIAGLAAALFACSQPERPATRPARPLPPRTLAEAVVPTARADVATGVCDTSTTLVKTYAHLRLPRVAAYVMPAERNMQRRILLGLDQLGAVQYYADTRLGLPYVEVVIDRRDGRGYAHVLDGKSDNWARGTFVRGGAAEFMSSEKLGNPERLAAFVRSRCLSKDA